MRNPFDSFIRIRKGQPFVIGKTKYTLKTLNEAGYTMIEVVVAAALLTVVATGFFSSVGHYAKLNADSNFKTQLSVITWNLKNNLLDDEAFARTVANSSNTIFDCLKEDNPTPWDLSTLTNPDCLGKSGDLAAVNNKNGDVIVDVTSGQSGMTITGEACNTYGTSPDCYKPKIEIRYECAGIDCKSPELVIGISVDIFDSNTGTTRTVQLDELRRGSNILNGEWRNVTPGTPAINTTDTFKLLIIVDNSTSMQAYQSRLAANMTEFLMKFRTLQYGISVQIMTTTQFLQHGVNSWENPTPLADNISQILKLDFQCIDQYTGVTAASSCPDADVPGVQIETANVKPPARFNLPYGATQAQYDAFSLGVRTAITTAGTSGSDNEQPLCTLARVVKGQTSFLVDNDKVGVIIIANEDDSSSTATCADEIRRTFVEGFPAWRSGPLISTDQVVPAGTPFIEYYIKQRVGDAGYHITSKCMQYRDGGFMPYSSTDSTSYRKFEAWAPEYVQNLPTAMRSPQSMTLLGIDITKSCATGALASAPLSAPSDTYSRFGEPAVQYREIDCPASVIQSLEEASWPFENCHELAGGGIPATQNAKVGPGSCKIKCMDPFNFISRVMRDDYNGPSGVITSRMYQFGNYNYNFCRQDFHVKQPVFHAGLGGYIQRMYPGLSTDPDTKNYPGGMVKRATDLGYELHYASGDPCARVPMYFFPTPDHTSAQYTSIFQGQPQEPMNIEDAIMDIVTTRFGLANFFMSAIIHPSSGSTCTILPEESIGTRIEAVANAAQKHALIPICNNDYTPALIPLSRFISAVNQNSTTITLANYEYLARVIVYRNGQSFEFPIGGANGLVVTMVNHAATNSTSIHRIDFDRTAFSLQPTDVIYYNVKRRITVEPLL